MLLSKDISLNHLNVSSQNGLSHGGSQLWFPKDGSFRDRAIHSGGCGLIAACDLMLWYENKAAEGGKTQFRSPVAACRKNGPQPDKETYMNCIRKLWLRYPVLPKFGSSIFYFPVYINTYLNRNNAHLRLSFLFKNTADKRMRIIRDSLEDGFPCIMTIGPRVLPFSRLNGLTFYTKNDGVLKPAVSDIRRHFVTVTGIDFPDDSTEPVYLEISSWGRRYFINYDELTEYMNRRSTPWLTGFFYLKTERGARPFTGTQA